MPSVRIALPEALRPRAEAAALRLPGPRPQLISPPLPADPRQRLRWQRLWQERRAGAGASPAEAEAALHNPLLRAVLLTLDRGADAALLDEGDAGCAAAWQLLEPLQPTGACAELYLGSLPGATAPAPGFGWFDWPASGELSPAASQFHAAVAETARLAQAPAVPLLVDFSNGRNPLRPQWERWLLTLQARMPAQSCQLYSPLFYRQGELQAAALVDAVGLISRAATPVLCVPRLARRDFAASLLAAGGRWAGPFRAGAEVPAARLAPHADAASCQATLEWLSRALAA
ncbi:MAG: hypothetical protein ACRD1L_04140 [Terriglobales bacterium]